MKTFILRFKRNIDVKIRGFVTKHTSFKNTFAGLEIGNVLVALSTTCLMGVGSLPFSIPVIVFLAAILVILGVVGKYIDEVKDDNERMILYEEHLKEFLRGKSANEGAVSHHPCVVRNDCVQSPNSEDKERRDRKDGSGESGG